MKAPWKRITDLTARKETVRQRAPARAKAVVRGEAADYVAGRMAAMMQSAAGKSPVFPPGTIFNEQWLLRLIIDWYATHAVVEHAFTLPPKGRWLSQALLPTAFGRGVRPTKLAEPPSEVDGVVGHVAFGETEKGEVSLAADAKHLVVVQAKLFAGLSAGPANLKYFDEVARVSACVAETLSRANQQPADIPRLAFYVVAPQVQIARGVFAKSVTRSAIGRKVKRRATEVGGKKVEWHAEWFEPTLEHMEVGTLSWEELVRPIREEDPASAAAIQWFYQQCIGFSDQIVKKPAKRAVKEDATGGHEDTAGAT